jgi:hypothetical protein
VEKLGDLHGGEELLRGHFGFYRSFLQIWARPANPFTGRATSAYLCVQEKSCASSPRSRFTSLWKYDDSVSGGVIWCSLFSLSTFAFAFFQSGFGRLTDVLKALSFINLG